MHDDQRLRPTLWAITAQVVCLGLITAVLSSSRAAAAQEDATIDARAETQSLIVSPQKRASFSGEPASKDVRQVADWVVDSGDNQSLPFVIVDKMDAKVFVFDKEGRLNGAAPALLGLARGDDSAPGIGDRALSQISPEERTTPAGRFVAALGNDLGEQDILWVDYDAAISLHRVITTSPKDRRLQRLATPSVLDNRISYGCINVPVKFYESIVRPAFIGTNGIVYILPETRSIRDVFPGFTAPALGLSSR